MNLRAFVVLVYAIAFLLSIIGVASIPAQAWQYIEVWQQLLFGFYFLVGFCGIVIAYCIYYDAEDIDYLMREIEQLKKSEST